MIRRRIPTKAELLRLQKLYRTDKKIATAMGGGVTDHLVAYWRRKKGIAKYSFPKFSQQEVQEMWDRFGDDFRAGMELGISKAAFYNWRRRYKISNKPEALKLEQLTLGFYTHDARGRKRPGAGRQTVAQKILCGQSGKKSLEPGESVEIAPELILVAGNAGTTLDHFGKSGISYVQHPSRIIISLEDNLTRADENKNNPETEKRLRDFARLQKIKTLYESGHGSLSQLTIETAALRPGQFGVISDAAYASQGSLGAFVTPIGDAETARLWSSGAIEITTPETIRVMISGKMPRGLFARDIAHHIETALAGEETAGTVIELAGTGLESLTIPERITLCLVLSQADCAGLICAYDATTRRYINSRAQYSYRPAVADRNAVYKAEVSVDLNTLNPVAVANQSGHKLIAIDQLQDSLVNYIYLGGPANGRFADMKIAAEVLKGSTISANVRLIIQAASSKVYLEALKKGLIRVFVEAGAVVTGPGGLCQNGCFSLPAEGEVALTTHHDLKFYSPGCRVYQVSPASAAASALTGHITNPTGYIKI